MQDASLSYDPHRDLEPDPIDLNEPEAVVVEDDEQDERWEHYVEFIKAKAEHNPVLVQQFYPAGSPPEHAVHALIPRLNELGDEGWELVHMQPVDVSYDGEIILNTAQAIGQRTHTYLCAFKRRIS